MSLTAYYMDIGHIVHIRISISLASLTHIPGFNSILTHSLFL